MMRSSDDSRDGGDKDADDDDGGKSDHCGSN